MKSNSTTATPEAWRMCFLANGTPGTQFCTDDITVVDAWLRAHLDDAEVIPLCRVPPRQYSHEQYIGELRVALARVLHMHRVILGTTHYRKSITDAHCTREIHETPLQALNILARCPHKKDEV